MVFKPGPKKMSANPSSLRSRKWRAANRDESRKYMAKYMREYRKKKKASKGKAPLLRTPRKKRK